MKRAILIGGGCFAALVIGLFVLSRGEGRPSVGEVGYLEDKPGAETVWVPIDEAALKELVNVTNAKNSAAAGQMLRSERLLIVPTGTKATVVERGYFTATVRIIGGEYDGRTGVVPIERIHKTPR